MKRWNQFLWVGLLATYSMLCKKEFSLIGNLSSIPRTQSVLLIGVPLRTSVACSKCEIFSLMYGDVSSSLDKCFRISEIVQPTTDWLWSVSLNWPWHNSSAMALFSLAIPSPTERSGRCDRIILSAGRWISRISSWPTWRLIACVLGLSKRIRTRLIPSSSFIFLM